MRRVLTFGEIMLRISPSDRGERIVQSNRFRIEPGGSESNVAIALANLGNEVAFLTKLPDNQLGEIVYRYLRHYKVDTSHIATGGKRLGLYWTEIGVGPRASFVVYDRQDSAFAHVTFADFDWDRIKENAFWFHTSGISPAVSRKASETLEEILVSLDEGIRISLDLNYRENLWKWIEPHDRGLINTTMLRLCSKAFLLIGNETDFQNALGFGEAKKSPDVLETYSGIAKQAFERLPNSRYVAISLRDSSSASENIWSGILFVKKEREIVRFVGPKFKLSDIVDRVGTGDSFAAGMIHGIMHYAENPQYAVDFAVALSALSHTVRGDASQFAQSDVESTLATGGSGQIVR